MSAPENQDGRRGGRPYTAVFWTGIGLAPLAALVVLVSNGVGGLRVAALLAVLSVVLIGLSVMMRPDATAVRTEMEESLFDEIDGLRADVREDITTAARATHKSFSEKLQSLYEHVEALRGQLDTMRDELEARDRKATAKPAVQAERPAPAPQSPRPVGTAMVGGGVVRHTETVQVTTRQTIVDGDRGRVYGTSSVYGQRSGEGDRSTVGRHDRSERDDRQGRTGWDTPREESWTEQRLRDRLRDTGTHLFGDPGRFTSGGSTGSHAIPSHRDSSHDDYERDDYARRARTYGRSGSHVDDPGNDPQWSDMRAGDRWASVRSDDRGRELRMGERRAAVHSDESGTEMRIEDRWAAVRRQDAAGYRDAPAETRRERREREERWSQEGGGRHGSPAALPSAEEYGPNWSRDWRDEPRSGQRERERVDRWGREEEELPRPVSSPRGGRLHYDLADDRWR